MTENGQIGVSPVAIRQLDILIPSYNRPAKLHHILQTGLNLAIPGVTFIVIDDGSKVAEDVPYFGSLSTEEVCASFNDQRILYIFNPQNMGLAAALQRYYREFCAAQYTMLVNDKDEFIAREPIISALRKLEADSKLSMVMIPLRQVDREMDDRPLLFSYPRMSGKEFLAHYIEDPMLQHAGMYGIIRVDAVRAAGVPRPLNLRHYGLDDAFGIDIDFLFMVATTGDIDFESEAHVRRSVVDGATERFPLTFAYSYYQYAKRVMCELRARKFVTEENARRYIGWWILLICRGLVVAYRPVHGSELEPGTGRIRRHLPLPILLYLPLECLHFWIRPTREMISLYKTAAKIIFYGWWDRWHARVTPGER